MADTKVCQVVGCEATNTTTITVNGGKGKLTICQHHSKFTNPLAVKGGKVYDPQLGSVTPR